MKLLDYWLPLKGYERFYDASFSGFIRRRDTGGAKSYWIEKDGYYTMNVPPKGSRRVHRLIALTFVPNPDNKAHVDHIDQDKLNNRASNLRWLTQHEHIAITKANFQNAHKLKPADVIFIRQNFWLLGKENLSKQYGVAGLTIYAIATGRARMDVDYPVHHENMGTTKLIIDLNTGVFYESAKELGELIGVKPKEIRRRLSGERPNNTPYRYC